MIVYVCMPVARQGTAAWLYESWGEGGRVSEATSAGGSLKSAGPFSGARSDIRGAGEILSHQMCFANYCKHPGLGVCFLCAQST